MYLKKTLHALQWALFLGLLSLPAMTFATVYPWPQAGCPFVGQLQLAKVGLFTDITALDEQYGVGYGQVAAANPGYPVNKLSAGQTLLVPTRYILPMAAHEGVVVNIPEMRLYYYDQENHLLVTYPVGVGLPGEKTPLGETRIVKKVVDPTWVPTNDTKAGFLQKYGFPLPDAFPPGPQNPLGGYAIRLGFTNILIHGTNDPSGVGKRVSGGCIRMQNADIGELFDFVWVGMPVTVVNQPYKTAWDGQYLYLEAHRPIKDAGPYVGYKALILEAEKTAPPGKLTINWQRAKEVAHLQMGVPQIIGWVGT